MPIFIDVVDSLRVEKRGSAFDAVDLIPLFEQKLRQVGTILSCNTSDKRAFRHIKLLAVNDASLVRSEKVSAVHLIGNVYQAFRSSVGDIKIRHYLELFQVVNNSLVVKMRCGNCGFVGSDFYSLGLDSLHHVLDGGCAKIVRARLHY